MIKANAKTTSPALAESIALALRPFPYLRQVVIFGSLAKGKGSESSDLDVAVLGTASLTTAQRHDITTALALHVNRPIDLVDLATVGQPLLDQIVASGVQVIGTPQQWGDLVFRNILDQEDFVPYQDRILRGRRAAWIGR
jgi:predicted nucleotidyltransferase